MILLGYASIAFLMMRQKPVRSILSMLGIFIGVLSLAVILAMHEGMRRTIDELYRTDGASVVLVQPGYDEATQKMGVLQLSDIDPLKALPGVLGAWPRLSGAKQARSARDSMPLNLLGVDEEFANVYRLPLKAGRFFLPREIKSREPVLVLTEAAAKKLFPIGDPIGALVNLEGQSFEVIGVAAWSQEIGTRSFLSEEPGALLAPNWLVSPGTPIQTVEVRVSLDVADEPAVSRIRSQLTHADSSRDKLFMIQALKEFLKQEKEMSEQSLKTLLAIAAISLIVGGVGVANVMLTSVTERTREIGVRKALGAQRKDILLQFLVESCLLSATGGLLAVFSAWVGIAALPAFYPIKLRLVLPPLPIAGCLVLTMIIGLLAGLYPASRAAQRSPADALRYE